MITIQGQKNHQFTRRSLTFFFIVFFVASFIPQVQCEISLLKYYEAEHTLAHVIQNVKANKHQQIDDSYEQKCTKSNDCCLCKKNFRNATLLQLHMQIHHPKGQKKPEDTFVVQMFDKRINSEFRFQTCLKVLEFIDLESIINKERTLWSETSQQISLPNNFTLNNTQKVDVCTIIAYGAYHQPLWMTWVRGTLIFVFAIVFLVYYANVIDEIKTNYFPKKKKDQRLSK